MFGFTLYYKSLPHSYLASDIRYLRDVYQLWFMIEFLLITLIPVLSIVLIKKHRDWYNLLSPESVRRRNY